MCRKEMCPTHPCMLRPLGHGYMVGHQRSVHPAMAHIKFVAIVPMG